MAKAKRGRTLWNLPSRGRGTCPVCANTRIKLLYVGKAADGKSIKVCKRCQGKTAPAAPEQPAL